MDLKDEAVLDICLVFLQKNYNQSCVDAKIAAVRLACEFFYGVFRGAQFSTDMR